MSAPSADLPARLVAKLREALEFFNDHPNFSLRFDRARTSYKIAADIDRLLKEMAGAAPPPAASPAEAPTAAPPAKPARFAEATSYSPLQMEAALCAWEWMLGKWDDALLKELWEGVGSSAMRFCSIQAGDIAHRTYEHMKAQGYEFIGAYDWEFVPDVLAKLDWSLLVDDNQFARAPYDPDVDVLFTAMVAADKSARPPGRRLFSKAAAS